MAGTFVITKHAVERYVERCGGAYDQARTAIRESVRRAAQLKERTYAGDRYRVDSEQGIVHVVKRDKGQQWAVVTVLSLREWEEQRQQHQERIADAALLLPPLEDIPRGNQQTVELLAKIARLKEKNQLLAQEVNRLAGELNRFRGTERARAPLTGETFSEPEREDGPCRPPTQTPAA